jgi:hypothetical protein
MYAAMIEGSSYLTFRNNIFEGYAGPNVNPSNGPNDHFIFINNHVIVDTSILNCNIGSDCWPVGIALHDAPYATVKNNIFYDTLHTPISIQGTASTGIDMDYNLAYNSDGSTPRGNPQPNDLWGVDPMFVNRNNEDYHLHSDSPAIDAGDNLGLNNDYEGNTRPQGAGYDIGAFEYSSGTVLNADINGDGFVNIIDLILVSQRYGSNNYYGNEDVNGDNQVNLIDLIIVAQNFT